MSDLEPTSNPSAVIGYAAAHRHQRLYRTADANGNPMFVWGISSDAMEAAMSKHNEEVEVMRKESLNEARAKLENPELGSLTPDEMQALLNATQAMDDDTKSKPPAPRRSSLMAGSGSKTHAELIDKILDITEQWPRDKARDVLRLLFAEREVTAAVIQTWSDEEAYSAITIGY